MPKLRLPLLAALIALVPASAESPTLNGDYNTSTHVLSLTWPAMGTSYQVFANGELVQDVTDTRLDLDLSAWTEGVREYVVVVLDESGAVTDSSSVFRLEKNVVLPSDCPVASVSVYTEPPGAQYTVHTECLPG